MLSPALSVCCRSRLRGLLQVLQKGLMEVTGLSDTAQPPAVSPGVVWFGVVDLRLVFEFVSYALYLG